MVFDAQASGDGAHSVGAADLLRDLCVAHRGSGWDGAQGLPDAFLKGGSLRSSGARGRFSVLDKAHDLGDHLFEGAVVPRVGLCGNESWSSFGLIDVGSSPNEMAQTTFLRRRDEKRAERTLTDREADRFVFSSWRK